uniref:Uncharacterized protein n=1 Tax=Erpetoichthys calabaricus TaxID=27687 RepID=A0A8C4RIA5_ERPCA
MAEVEELQKLQLLQALTHLVSRGRELLQSVNEESRRGLLKDFALNNLNILFGFTDAGANFLTSLSVKKRSDAEKLWEHFFQDEDVRDHVEELLQLEVDWDEFLQHLDSSLNLCDTPSVPMVRLGGYVPGDLQLKDARTNEHLKLSSYFRRGTKTLLVLLRHFA